MLATKADDLRAIGLSGWKERTYPYKLSADIHACIGPTPTSCPLTSTRALVHICSHMCAFAFATKKIM